MSLLLALTAAAASLQPDALATQAMHNFGACVVKQTPSGARELLALDYWTKAYDRKMRAVAKGHERCAPGSTLRFNHLLFAGALAEALVESRAKPRELATKLAYDTARTSMQARDATEEMALCTVLKAPDAASAVFATQPATAEEVRALQPLGSVLGECLKKDTKIELNKPALRSLLALAAYRILSAPEGASQ